ncbi:MAG: tRNA 2-thiocytidine biosynthesis TtcA family protein [Oscillospiraceae bacterium]|nr:tRNA 2-thiocytidine biosynthesis TtcA family protein [Oscillospiraceae bacterium]
MQRLEGLMRKAAQQYHMIEAGDRICVGVSGGKDSVALTIALSNLRRYYEKPFTLQAITLDPGFGGKEMDYSVLQALFEKHQIPYTIKRTQIGAIVFDVRKEQNPCSLCAKMRRGALHDLTKELGCNKLALGHHLDDAIETFYMNLWQNGRIGCFEPVSYLSRKDLTMIRPLILATEQDVTHAIKSANLPIVKSICPADGVTTRQDTKEFVHQMVRQDHAFRGKMLNAFQTGGISGWCPLETGNRPPIKNKQD